MSGEGVAIRPFRTSDVGAFVSHLARQARESGKDGAPHFAPRAEFDRDEMRARIERQAATPLDQPHWERAWLVWAPDAGDRRSGERVVGHVDLRGGRLPAEMHRTVLGLGLERAFWRRGLGEGLVRTAVAWAREQAALGWIDLFVFAENAPARALYAKVGFEDRGTVEDAFRLSDGTTVGDVRMVLRLR